MSLSLTQTLAQILPSPGPIITASPPVLMSLKNARLLLLVGGDREKFLHFLTC